MPLGELKINGVDAYVEYGMSLEDGGVSALMTPPPAKERVKNKSRLRHGEEAAGTLERVDSREITIPFHISAPTKEICMGYYHKLCQVLKHGTIEIWSRYIPDEKYRCKYLSCTNFSQFNMEMMKFVLKVEELNPEDRSL